MTKYNSTKWEWDHEASDSYNAMAKLESTLINFGIIADYSDIEITESYDKRFSKFPQIEEYYREQFIRFNNNAKFPADFYERADGDSNGSDV